MGRSRTSRHHHRRVFIWHRSRKGVASSCLQSIIKAKQALLGALVGVRIEARRPRAVALWPCLNRPTLGQMDNRYHQQANSARPARKTRPSHTNLTNQKDARLRSLEHPSTRLWSAWLRHHGRPTRCRLLITRSLSTRIRTRRARSWSTKMVMSWSRYQKEHRGAA